MADVLHGLTQFADLIPENFAPAVEGFFRSQLRLLSYAYDASAWGNGGGTITYPIQTMLPPVSKVSETPLTEHVAMADPDRKATIDLSTQFAIPLFFELIAMKQVILNPGLLMNYSENGGYALRKEFETLIASTIQSATINDRDAGTNNTLTWAEVLLGWGKMGQQNIAPYQTVLGMSGATWGNSVNSWGRNYTSAGERGDAANFLATGEWGHLGQTPVNVLSDWAETDSAGIECASLWTKNAVGYGIQGGVDVLGPSPAHLKVGIELTLAMNGGTKLAVDEFVVNWNNT